MEEARAECGGTHVDYRAGDTCLHARLIASLPSFKKGREKEREEMTEGVDGCGFSLI